MITSSASISRITLAALVLALAAGCTSQELFTHAAESRQQGVEQFNEHNYADAAGSFRNAARQDPRDYKSLYYLGVCYDQMNQNHQAIEAYKSSLDAQPHSLIGQEDGAGRL